MKKLLKKLLKNRDGDPISYEEVDNEPYEGDDDFWGGMSDVFAEHMPKATIVLYDGDDGVATINIDDVRAAIIELRPDKLPVLCLHVGIPSNVAAKIALTVDRYCDFALGQVFLIEASADGKKADFRWGSEATKAYQESIYLLKRERVAKEKEKLDKDVPEGATFH